MFTFWQMGEEFVRLTNLPIPGAIVGLFVVLALLISKKLNIRMVQRGARWFLAQMLLFFVPAALAILDHPEFLGFLGFKILVLILLSTLIVMVVTGGTIEICYRWSLARKDQIHAKN